MWRAAVTSLSTSDIFALMDSAVADSDSALAAQLDADVEWVVDGELHVLSAASSERPGRLKVNLSLATLRELLLSELTPQEAFRQRKLKIKGKLALALKLQHVLDAVRQRVEKQGMSRL